MLYNEINGDVMEFERLELLIGSDNLNKLKNKTVLVLGVGGVGGYVVESIARSAIGHLILVDFDKVDVTNINRQIIADYDTVGKLKVDCFKERIKRININCVVDTYPIFYGADNREIIFNQHIDYIVDCCDSLNSKVIIIEEAIKRGIKIISSMGTGNKFCPELLKVSKLKNTCYDPLAKKLRYLLKDNKEALNIKVIYSEEVPVKGLEKIGSTSFVPSSAGLLLSSVVIRDFLEENKNEIY